MKNFNELLDSLSHEEIKGVYTALYTDTNILPYIHIILHINTMEDVVALKAKYKIVRRIDIINSI